MRFENPANGYVETCTAPFLWALIFGPLYFVLKGVWRHVVLYFVVNSILLSVAGVLAFGSFYAANFAAQSYNTTGSDAGNTAIAVGVAIAALVLPFLLYPFIATGIIRRHYLRAGWVEID